MKTSKAPSRVSKLLATIAREKNAAMAGKAPADRLRPELYPRYKSVFSQPVRRIIE